MELPNHTEQSLNKENLIWKVLFISIFILLLEVFFGLLSNSLALIADALHVFTDIFSGLIALIAIRMSRRACDSRFPMGYHRFEVMASFLNGLLLLMAVAVIFNEAYKRIVEGASINAPLLMPAAIIGLLGNIYVVKILHSEHKHDLNIKGVYLHAFSDTLSSFAVIFGGFVMIFTGETRIDSFISFFIGIFIGYNALKLLWESSILLLHGVPPDVDIKEVKGFIMSLPGIIDVHSINIYALCSNVRYIDVHVVVDDMKLSEANEIRKNIKKEVEKKFKLTITSIQLEHA